MLKRFCISLLVILAVVSCVDVYAHNRRKAQDNCHKSGDSYHCHDVDTTINFESNEAGYYALTEVTDGDTFEFQFDNRGTIEIRLYGVNTPELGSKNEKEAGLAEAAKEYVTNKLKDKNIFLLFDDDDHFPFIKQGKYGRYLAYLFYVEDGMTRMLNLELIKEGHSDVSFIENPFRYRWAFIDVKYNNKIDLIRERYANLELPEFVVTNATSKETNALRLDLNAAILWAKFKAE